MVVGRGASRKAVVEIDKPDTRIVSASTTPRSRRAPNLNNLARMANWLFGGRVRKRFKVQQQRQSNASYQFNPTHQSARTKEGASCKASLVHEVFPLVLAFRDFPTVGGHFWPFT